MPKLPTIHRSIRRKVLRVCIATTLIALVLSGAALVLFDASQYRRGWVADLRTQADILALSSAPALAFDDEDAAHENLAALRVRQSVISAALYGADGAPFAVYARNGAAPPGPRIALEAEGYRFESGTLLLRRDVMLEGQRIGMLELRASFAPFDRLLDYLTILVLVMLASLAAALLLSVNLQRAVTAPIVAMAQLARRIMEKRDYSLRAPSASDNETAALVDAFNGMLAEVERHAGALQAANRNLEREMQDRLVAEAALRAADARKDEFLATLAHELRNPLAALSGASQLLDRSSDQAATRLARETLGRQIQHMARLLDDLLDVSRITRGKLVLRKEMVAIRELIDTALQAANPLLTDRDQSLTVKVDEDSLRVHVDPVRVAQVLSNLLTNAAKYTDRGGRIALLARSEGEVLTFCVRDNGMGISPEALPRIFGMFSQVHSALERSQGGLGIGLALARGLVELHGGTIEAHSEGPDRGSEFIVRLPLAEPLKVAAAPRESVLDASWACAPRRLLLADDNSDALASLALVLQLEGHAVATARDGEEALSVAAAFQPDVALLDIGMPRLNGYEVARCLRSRDSGEAITLIAVSGWGQEDDKRKAAEAGFDRHLTKPVDVRVLRALLAETAPVR